MVTIDRDKTVALQLGTHMQATGRTKIVLPGRAMRRNAYNKRRLYLFVIHKKLSFEKQWTCEYTFLVLSDWKPPWNSGDVTSWISVILSHVLPAFPLCIFKYAIEAFFRIHEHVTYHLQRDSLSCWKNQVKLNNTANAVFGDFKKTFFAL